MIKSILKNNNDEENEIFKLMEEIKKLKLEIQLVFN
jgi:hypothetical protein